MITLLKKEISTFIHSLTGYITISVFLLVNGLFLLGISNRFQHTKLWVCQSDGLFMLAPFVFLFLMPAITMRSFADEQRTGTIELLLTKPLTEMQIVWAKFLANVMLMLPLTSSYINLFLQRLSTRDAQRKY